MSSGSHEFGSPKERSSTIFLRHVAGFEVTDAGGETTFVTIDDLEKDADARPSTLRDILRGEYSEVSALSGEFLLRNLVVPNLPLGLYGDEDGLQPSLLLLFV